MKGQLVISLIILLQILSLSCSSPPSPTASLKESSPLRRIRRQAEGQLKAADNRGHRARRISGVSHTNSLEFNEDDDSTPSVRVHLVKNEDLARWTQSQGPDAILTRHPLAPSVLMLHHRYPSDGPQQLPVKRAAALSRQGVPQNFPGRQSAPGIVGLQNTDGTYVVTPVLPINGDKKYNDTDCLPWEEVAILLRSSMYPKFKRQYIDPRSCNLKMGLECLPFEEKGATIHKCRCMLVYGPKAAYTNFTDQTGRTKSKCFIPAGLGWDSECNAKTWNNYGYPLPFGDPSGTNAEQAAQTDAFNKGDGEQVIVEYIRWNSIVPECVPGAECREKGTYTGQRCQCKPGHFLEKPRGLCNGGWGMKGEGSWMVRRGLMAAMLMILLGNY